MRSRFILSAPLLALLGALIPPLHAAQGPSLVTDPAAMRQLVEAVSLDVLSETTVEVCQDLGLTTAAPAREAWLSWRERQQIAPMRVLLTRMMQRRGGDAGWEKVSEPLRAKLLAGQAATNADGACASLARDLPGPGMDLRTRYPQAAAVARDLAKADLVMPITPLPVVAGTPRGELLLPTQVAALSEQRGQWLSISDEAALRRLGVVYVTGRVVRNARRSESFTLEVMRGDRVGAQLIHLKFNAEAWLGREIVLRGVVTSLNRQSMDLAAAALVTDPSGLTPSRLSESPLKRPPVLLQRVTRAPGQGLAERDLAAVVIHGEANTVNGSSWREDVRYLLRDGSVYRRTEMPPDQLDVAASRRLEPQRWGRWRQGVKGYEMQAQDDDGRPLGDLAPMPHLSVKPWSADTRLEGSFSRASFTGSMVTGGTSSTRAIRFTRDGRFERSFHALSSTGSLQAITGTVVAGSSQGDGQGSSRTGGGTVGTGTGSVGVSGGTRKTDDGASRRGRYRLDGFVITLDYDDGHQERLLSFPVDANQRSVFIGTGSYDLAR